MWILGPLVAATTSTVTVALARAALSLVTDSPSTSRRTGSSTVAPGSAWTRSISRTSPTATFSWRPPARTIAYTIEDSALLSALASRGPRRTQHGRTRGPASGRTPGVGTVKGTEAGATRSNRPAARHRSYSVVTGLVALRRRRERPAAGWSPASAGSVAAGS